MKQAKGHETLTDRESMQIQWYPGHMAKARRMLTEHLKMIDVVVELVDARAPAATRNPDFDALFATKSRVVLLNKADIADAAANKAWIAYFAGNGVFAAEINATAKNAQKTAAGLIARAARPKTEAWKARGVNKVVRCMVVGIPNVGKSTLINCMAGVHRAQVGDRPGVTKGKQWVRISPYLELMDTPGLLWPKLENPLHALHLACLGSINDEIMDAERLAAELLSELMIHCPDAVCARYGTQLQHAPQSELLAAVAKKRGFLLRGGELDTERAARVVLDEYRGGRIARITLERPESAEQTVDSADGGEYGT